MTCPLVFGAANSSRLLGPSGSGKSTILNMIAHSGETGSGGQILIDGKPVIAGKGDA